MKDCYLWTFATSDTDAGLKERSAVFSYKGIQAVYEHLDPDASYVLALTYASDHVYKRVQSLEANGVVLHGPYALPKAKATRVIVKVPPECHARRQDDVALEDTRRGQCHRVHHRAMGQQASGQWACGSAPSPACRRAARAGAGCDL